MSTGGRLDETGSPVIFEYKRAVNESVINQGLFYLDWLVDHKGEFQLLVMEKLDPAVAADIDWRNPRVICVASGFTRYDENAVMQMSRSIELVRYQDFEGELLALELVTAAKMNQVFEGAEPRAASAKAATSKTVTQYLAGSPQTPQDLFADLEAFIEALGDEVTKKTLKFYLRVQAAEELRLRGGAPTDADASGVSQGGPRHSSARRGVQSRCS